MGTSAYAAGLIDGEGCVYITKAKERSFGARIDMGMTVSGMDALRLMHREYGGLLRMHRAETDKWAEAHMLAITGPAAVACLRDVLPFLRVKREQAEIVLRLEELRLSLIPPGGQRAMWTDEARDRGEAMFWRVRELNRKGPSQEREMGDAIALLAGGEWIEPQLSLFGDLGSEKFSGPWPRSGSMRSGRVSERATSVPFTAVIGSGSSLLPTPTAAEYGTNTGGSSGRVGEPRPSLGHMARHDLWPTPTASRGGQTLPEGSTETGIGPDGKKRTVGLSYAVKRSMGPTPTKSDASPSQIAGTHGKSLAAEAGGSLNPEFVESLMGAPVGWTDPDVTFPSPPGGSTAHGRTT